MGANQDMTAVVSVPCAACAKPVHIGDDFCEACGAKVDEASRRALSERLEASDSKAQERGKLIKGVSNTILTVAVLFVFGGIVFFFLASSQSSDALAQIASLDASAPLNEPIAGATTIGELRDAVEREPYQVLGLNLFLAVLMLGLFFWSKRATLPAAISALGVFVMVHLASALMDPKTLAQGVIIKVIVVVALVKGIKAALDARALGVAH